MASALHRYAACSFPQRRDHAPQTTSSALHHTASSLASSRSNLLTPWPCLQLALVLAPYNVLAVVSDRDIETKLAWARFPTHDDAGAFRCWPLPLPLSPHSFSLPLSPPPPLLLQPRHYTSSMTARARCSDDRCSSAGREQGWTRNTWGSTSRCTGFPPTSAASHRRCQASACCATLSPSRKSAKSLRSLSDTTGQPSHAHIHIHHGASLHK